MLIPKNISSSCRDRGQNLVEFALVLPLLVLILFGAVDLGRVYFATITLTSAAREGARYLSVYPDDVSNPLGAFYGTRERVIREASNSGINISSGQITVSCTNTDDEYDFCDGGSPASVTVSHSFDLIMGWVLPSPITLTRSAEMVVP